MSSKLPQVAALAALLAACAGTGTPRPDPPTVEEVVKMAKAGTAPEEIIRRMQESNAVYPLPASDLARLRGQGVADQVIDHMQRSWIEAVRREERLRHWQYDFYYGFPRYRGYPYWGWPYWGPWP